MTEEINALRSRVRYLGYLIEAVLDQTSVRDVDIDGERIDLLSVVESLDGDEQ